MTPLPETVLQFGAGNFLRGFADLFIHHANLAGQDVGRVVVVQSTGGERARLLNEHAGRYPVAVRGLLGGQVVDRVEDCASISRALVAAGQWPEVLELARSPALRYVVSNTTEAGYAGAFPSQLCDVLFARWQAGGGPLTILPCELIEDNAAVLRQQVLERAIGRPVEFQHWAGGQCHWLSSLVDRIVPGRPADHAPADHPLLIAAEPFAFWALQSKPGAGPWLDHPAVVRVADVRPYFLRKVRILNGAHSALVCVGLGRFETVLDAMNDAPTAAWLDRLLFDEIVPALAGRVDDAAGFARQTLERFRNPFLRHRLADIALHHEAKVGIRLRPTWGEFQARLGREPELLSKLLK